MSHRFICKLPCCLYGVSQVAQLVKNLPADAGDARDTGLIPGSGDRFLGGEDPLEKEMATHFSILAGEPHGQSSLAGYSPWGKKSQT